MSILTELKKIIQEAEDTTPKKQLPVVLGVVEPEVITQETETEEKQEFKVSKQPDIFDEDGMQQKFTEAFLKCYNILQEIHERYVKDYVVKAHQIFITNKKMTAEGMELCQKVVTGMSQELLQFATSTFPAAEPNMTDPEKGIIQQDVDFKRTLLERLQAEIESMPKDLPQDSLQKLPDNQKTKVLKAEKDQESDKVVKAITTAIEDNEKLIAVYEDGYKKFKNYGVDIINSRARKLGKSVKDLISMGKGWELGHWLHLPQIKVFSPIISDAISLFMHTNPFTAFLYDNKDKFLQIKIVGRHNSKKNKDKNKDRDKRPNKSKFTQDLQQFNIKDIKKFIGRIDSTITDLKPVCNKKDINNCITIRNDIVKCVKSAWKGKKKNIKELDKVAEHVETLYEYGAKIEHKYDLESNPFDVLYYEGLRGHAQHYTMEHVAERFKLLDNYNETVKKEWINKYVVNALNKFIQTNKLDKEEKDHIQKRVSAIDVKESVAESLATLYIDVSGFVKSGEKHPIGFPQLYKQKPEPNKIKEIK